ncbi:MAG: substrate-binding domain-containing protein [bacterium]
MKRLPFNARMFSLLLFVSFSLEQVKAQSDQKSIFLPKQNLRFIFITTCVEAKFFQPVQKGMADAAAMLGVACTFTGTEGVNIPAQVEMIRQALKEGYDGIALNIIDPVAFDGVVLEAKERGVPVVAFNVDDHATPNARLSAVCQKLYEAGKTLGTKALDFVPAGSRVLMTMHDKGVSALEDRLRGAQEVLKTKNIKWKVIISGNTVEKAVDVISRELKENPDIKIVLCTGQSDTEGAGTAIEKYFPGYLAAGFDVSPGTLRLIKAGHIRFSIDQQPYVQGFYPVVQLTHYCRYGIVPSNIDAGAGIIDKNNVDKVIQLVEERYR